MKQFANVSISPWQNPYTSQPWPRSGQAQPRKSSDERITKPTEPDSYRAEIEQGVESSKVYQNGGYWAEPGDDDETPWKQLEEKRNLSQKNLRPVGKSGMDTRPRKKKAGTSSRSLLAALFAPTPRSKSPRLKGEKSVGRAHGLVPDGARIQRDEERKLDEVGNARNNSTKNKSQKSDNQSQSRRVSSMQPGSSHTPHRVPCNPTAKRTLEEIALECGWSSYRTAILEDIGHTTPRPEVAGRELLGYGRVGIVEEVRCLPNFPTCARKRIVEPSGSQLQRERAVQAIRKEITMLRRVDHPHIIKIFGSYRERTSYRPSYFLLMYPVGESDLDVFLANAPAVLRGQQSPHLRNEYTEWIWEWLCCLSSALAYLHDNGIHHEDIKPKNIIHRRSVIYFTDFGSSREVDLVSQLTSRKPGIGYSFVCSTGSVSHD